MSYILKEDQAKVYARYFPDGRIAQIGRAYDATVQELNRARQGSLSVKPVGTVLEDRWVRAELLAHLRLDDGLRVPLWDVRSKDSGAGGFCLSLVPEILADTVKGTSC